ncbi:protein-L-isoaspartate(D-aspartate) O-methyltransferase [Spirochaetota bacterium]
MVDVQIISRGIKDRAVISAMLKIERHNFVSSTSRGLAYDDRPLPIQCSQTISQPYIVALMTEELGLSSASRVLEIGTGCGYQTAILAEIAKEVYTVERISVLYKSASKLLDRLGYKNVHASLGNGYLGIEEYAPYDRIILTAAPDKVPDALFSQLTDGGILIAPVGSRHYQSLKKYTRRWGRTDEVTVTGVSFVEMVNDD